MIPYFEPAPLSIGPLSLEPWGSMVASGFIAGSLLAQWIARRRGLDPRPFLTILPFLAVGAAVFGHLGMLFYRPTYYLNRPIELVNIRNGLSSYGGFFGCAAIAVVYFRKYKLDTLRYCDVLVIGVAFGWAIGRIGCFMVHDHIGRPLNSVHGWLAASLAWSAVAFPADAVGEGVAAAQRFELGLLDSALTWVTLIVLLALARRPQRPGALLSAGIILYSSLRFGADFLRNVDLADADVRLFGLTPAQYAAVIAIGIARVVIRTGKHRKPWPAPGVPSLR